MSNDLKKKIKEEWLSEFKELLPYSPTRYYKVIGPLIFGILISYSNWSDQYQIYIVCYPLWKDGVENCMKNSSIWWLLSNKKNVQFDIPFSTHIQEPTGALFKEATVRLREVVGLPTEGDVSLQQLNRLMDNFSGSWVFKAVPTTQAEMFELKVMSALYVNNELALKSALNETRTAADSWDPERFGTYFGTKEEWFSKLKERTGNREQFLLQINANLQDKKLQKLHKSQLIMV